MDWQSKKDCLDKLFEDPQANDSEIIRIHNKIIKDTDCSISEEAIQFLNKKDVQLLEPELVKVLKKNRLEAYSYLLVANNLLNVEDFKDDLLNGGVVASVAPPNTLRKLNNDLSLQSVQNIPKTQAAMMPTNTQTQNTHNGEASSSQDTNRLAIKLKDKCTYLKRVKGNLFSYLLDLKEMSTFPGASSYIKRFSLGEPDPKMTSAASKTILLMGATGSGKTTLINAMINYILGVELNDPFRFLLVDEKIRGGSQAHSQTEAVTAYDLHYQDGFQIPFSLTIVDTPGFNDTRGIERDKEITATIDEFFKHNSAGIQELDAVGFVVKSSDGRLTDSQQYIFDSILSIFGKDVKESIRFLVTFSDGNPPLVLDAIKEAKLPCLMDSNGLPSHQTFNNGFIYQFKQKTTNNALLEAQWENGMKNFNSFFNELSSMTTQSLHMTKDVLEKRKNLQILLNGMKMFKDVRQKKMEELRKTEELVNMHRDSEDANINFEMKVPVLKTVKVPVKSFSALNCTNCNITCHFPCSDSFLDPCPVFSSSNFRLTKTLVNFLPMPFSLPAGLITVAAQHIRSKDMPCIVCPQGCLKKNHIKEETRWEITQEEVSQTLYDVRRNYEEARGKKLNAEQLKSALQEDIKECESQIRNDEEVIIGIRNELKNIALTGDSHLSHITSEQCIHYTGAEYCE